MEQIIFQSTHDNAAEFITGNNFNNDLLVQLTNVSEFNIIIVQNNTGEEGEGGEGEEGEEGEEEESSNYYNYTEPLYNIYDSSNGLNDYILENKIITDTNQNNYDSNKFISIFPAG